MEELGTVWYFLEEDSKFDCLSLDKIQIIYVRPQYPQIFLQYNTLVII